MDTYEKKLALAKEALDSGSYDKETIEYIFPELTESDDERIRKAITEFFKNYSENGTWKAIPDVTNWIAWLEKQGENSVCKVKIGETYKCIASPRYTCFRMGDIYHVKDNFVAELINTCSGCFVLLENQGEQKPIIPKFRIGDIITPKDKNEHYTITDIVDEWYEFREKHINGGIPIHYQDAWQLVEQKPVEWSDEDEKMLERLIRYFEDEEYFSAEDDVAYSIWLKSLKDRVGCEVNCTTKQQWKPSDEQMEAVRLAAEIGTANNSWAMNILKSMYQDLQKLREE